MPIVLYSQPSCQPCKQVERKLKAENIPYEVVDITKDPAAAEMLRKAGFTGTPVIQHGDQLHTIAGLIGIVTAHNDG